MAEGEVGGAGAISASEAALGGRRWKFYWSPNERCAIVWPMAISWANALWEALPEDGSSMSNIRLREQLEAKGCDRAAYDAASTELVETKRALRGSGRGGTLRRATGPIVESKPYAPALTADAPVAVAESRPVSPTPKSTPTPTPVPVVAPTPQSTASTASDADAPLFHGAVEEFAWVLHQEIEERRGNGSRTAGEALIDYAIDRLENDDYDDLVEHPFVDIDNYSGEVRLRFDGYDMRGVDDDERTRIDLLVVHARSPIVTDADGKSRIRIPQLEEPMANDLIRSARRFVEEALDGFTDHLGDVEAQDLGRTIRASKKLTTVEICLVTNADVRSFDSANETLRGITFVKRVLDFKALRRKAMPDPIEVDFSVAQPGGLPCVALPQPNESYRAYLAVVPGSFLWALYDKFKQRLLEANVRSYLKASNKSVNSRIIDTARKQPEMFFAFNNGITVIAEDLAVETKPDGGVVLVRCRNLQIVNGGQTTASLYRAREKDRSLDLSKVFVPMKISCVNSPEQAKDLVQQISKFANSQNKVNLSDFGANLPFHVEMQRLSRVETPPTGAGRWYYERMRAEYETDVRNAGTPSKQKEFQKLYPKKQVLKKTDVARFYMIWDQKPNLVCYGAEKNYQQFRQHVIDAKHRAADDSEHKPEDFVPDAAWYRALIAKAIIVRSCGSIVDAQKVPGYRANIVAYAVALFAHERGASVDLEAIWRAQAIDSKTESWLQDATAFVRECITRPPSEGQNVGEWTKKPTCWSALLEAWQKRGK